MFKNASYRSTQRESMDPTCEFKLLRKVSRRGKLETNNNAVRSECEVHLKCTLDAPFYSVLFKSI